MRNLTNNLFAILALLVFSAALSEVPKETSVALSFNDAWNHSLQFLALEQIAITNADKTSGVIQAKAPYSATKDRFSCQGKKDYALDKSDFYVTVVVRSTSPTESQLQIQVSATETRIRYHHVLWIKVAKRRTHMECQSTGKLEASLLEYIRGK